MDEMQILGIVLLIVGIVLVCIEIYIPGFGLPGTCGIIGIAAGVYLKAENIREGMMLILIAAAIIGVMLIVSIALFRSSKIKSPIKLETEMAGKDLFVEGDGEESLVGKTGTALTDLHPAGKGEFGGEVFDVRSKGSYIRKGSKIRITEVNNNQMLVKEEM